MKAQFHIEEITPHQDVWHVPRKILKDDYVILINETVLFHLNPKRKISTVRWKVSGAFRYPKGILLNRKFP
jgi:hypothetical protein